MALVDLSWNGRRAAVSLTYDDGIPNHLDVAIPALEHFGFRGTFYLVTSSDVPLMESNAPRWRAAFERGHEIGNHTAHHPGWNIPDSRPPYQLERFTAFDIARELKEAAAWLDEHIGSDPGRTFAYPFAQDFIGPSKDRGPYRRAVEACCAGARLGAASAPNRHDTPAFDLRGFSFGQNTPLATLIGYCEQALACGGWAILDFHGIGGPWIETPAATHRALLEYLYDRSFWVAPVRDVLKGRPC